jgi:hypothetical protein
MAAPCASGKLYPLFTLCGASWGEAGRSDSGKGEGTFMAIGIAIAMFIALFGWGSTYFGWSDPDGKIQLALATTFILGIIGGYKVRN